MYFYLWSHHMCSVRSVLLWRIQHPLNIYFLTLTMKIPGIYDSLIECWRKVCFVFCTSCTLTLLRYWFQIGFLHLEALWQKKRCSPALFCPQIMMNTGPQYGSLTVSNATAITNIIFLCNCAILTNALFTNGFLCFSSKVYQLQQEAPHPRRLTCTTEASEHIYFQTAAAL